MYTCTCTYTWTANLCYLLNTHILHVIHLKREHVLLIVPIFLPFNPLPSLSSWIWFVVVLTVFGWVLIVPVYIWCPTCTYWRDAVRILVVSVRDILLGDYFRGFRLFYFFLEFPTQIDEGTCILRHWSVWRGIMIRGRPDWCGFVSVMRTTVTVPHPSCPDPTWPDRVPRAGIKDRTLIPDYQIISSPCVRPHVIINPP